MIFNPDKVFTTGAILLNKNVTGTSDWVIEFTVSAISKQLCGYLIFHIAIDFSICAVTEE